MTNKINHYNQFLLHLDEQQQKERMNQNLNKVNGSQDNLEDLLKKLNNDYESNYYTKYFSGYEKEKEIIDCENPNIFNENIKDILPSFYSIFNFPKSSISYKNPHSSMDSKEPGDIELKFDLERIKKRKSRFCSLEKKKIPLDKEIDTLEDLLEFIDKNPVEKNVQYNIELQNLHNIREPLEELTKIVGMQSLKKNIVEQILYFVQDFHSKPNSTLLIKNQDFLHTVLCGPPGTGKTEIAKLIGKMYSKLGILSKGTFKKVTRSDLVAGYLGQTAIKTKEVIQESLGGVLFIDEAYSLGNSEKRDSFSKECIDTLCEAMSDHKDNLMVIIAGYEEEIRDCLFSYNQGLESRFTWRFQTNEYSAEELYLIFLKKVKEIGWSISQVSTDQVSTDQVSTDQVSTDQVSTDQVSTKKNDKTKNRTKQEKIDVYWFEKNKHYFKYYGRDIETLLSRIKIAHSKRVFGKEEEMKTKISYQDIEKGLEMFLKNLDHKKRDQEKERKRIIESIYV